MPVTGRTPQERLREKVDKAGPATSPELGPCLLWTAALDTGGCPQFWLDGAMHLAHRVACVWESGPIPGDREIDHERRTRRCVQPDHLGPVTPQQNKQRSPRCHVTHYPHGQQYTPENTVIDRGTRTCTACRSERLRRRRRRQQGEVA